MMKRSYRDPGGLTARVVLSEFHAADFDVDARWNGMLVDSVYTDPRDRRRGAATRLMTLVCEEADRERTHLFLGVVPDEDGPLDVDQLTAWYTGFGFICWEHADNLLWRPPGDWRPTDASCVTLDINDPAHDLEVVRGSKVMCARCHMHTHDAKIARRVRDADRRRRLNEVIDLTGE